MKKHILPALKLTFFSLLVLTVLYPLMLWAVAQMSPNQGKGVLIGEGNQKYYKQIGQAFSTDEYFWSRPSVVDYDAAGSGASNLSTTNPEYLKTVQERIDHFMAHNPGINKSDIPADLVTASGSGLDPHLSVKAVEIQVKRVATERQLPETEVAELVSKHVEQPLWGMFGPKKINVLELNMALDKMSKEKGSNNE